MYASDLTNVSMYTVSAFRGTEQHDNQSTQTHVVRETGSPLPPVPSRITVQYSVSRRRYPQYPHMPPGSSERPADWSPSSSGNTSARVTARRGFYTSAGVYGRIVPPPAAQPPRPEITGILWPLLGLPGSSYARRHRRAGRAGRRFGVVSP